MPEEINSSETKAKETSCGFIAVLGEPNAGKSTFVNACVGSKVSIVSPKVQTTRRRVLGISVRDEAQIIFIDTPGIFQAKRSLEKTMVRNAMEAAKGNDKILLLVDCKQKSFEGSFKILKKLENQKVVLVLNKIDLIEKTRLFEIAQQFQQFKQISNTFMISAKNGSGVQDLLKWIADAMPKGPWHYPEDQITDISLKLWAAEITREQLILQLQHELPYETYVETEVWENFDNGSVKIQQVIVVAREAQKGIMLGKRGERIKNIREKAAKQIGYHLGQKVHLFLFVKITEDWMSKSYLLREAGVID